MRDIVLVLATLFYLYASLAAPAAGLMCWEWFSIMGPSQQVYGFATNQPFNFVIAAATLLGWLFSTERKRLTPDALPWAILVWFLWMTVTTAMAPVPEYAWVYWYRVLRILVPIFLAFVLLTNRARIHGMIWVLVIAIGYYGVKGGGYMLLGHSGVIFGPPDSMIADNNALALAVVMQLPLVYYLWKHTRLPWLRIGLAVAIPLEILMVIGSHSRGGVIALSVMLGAFWLRTDRKILYGLIGAVMVAGALALMPDVIWTRLDTLNNVQGDLSFQQRLLAWHVALEIARDYAPFGVGFYGEQLPQIWDHYVPEGNFHAAHSIYFQVLGEHGYVGLAIYLLVLLLPLYNASLVVWRTRKNPELAWAHDLAEMLRVALAAFYVGGAALSLAYFDGYLVLAALTSTLRELAVPRRAAVSILSRTARVAALGSVATAEVGKTPYTRSARNPNEPRRAADGRRYGPPI
jgi:putative inorganic carbon (HCO3(-)) transporter